MTRVTVDAATVERLHGLSQYLELCDEQGNVLGRFAPSGDSPAFRTWLGSLDAGITDAEMSRREARIAEGVPTKALLDRLQGRP